MTLLKTFYTRAKMKEIMWIRPREPLTSPQPPTIFWAICLTPGARKVNLTGYWFDEVHFYIYIYISLLVVSSSV